MIPEGTARWEEWATLALLESRTVLVDRPIDADLAVGISAELMLLDASGDESVQLRIESGGGTLDGASMLIDVIDLLGVPVQGVSMGRAEGAALFVLAACDERIVGPHARLLLAEPPAVTDGFCDVTTAAAHHRARLDQMLERFSLDESLLRRSRLLAPDEAIALGLADAIATPEASIRRFPRQVGYRLR